MRAVTSVFAGFLGIERRAKSPASRLREADPGSPAVMSDAREVMSRGNAKGREKAATVSSVENAGPQGFDSLNWSVNRLIVIALMT